MAQSEIDICNIALTVHLGANPIQTFNDNTKEALLAKTSYHEIRNEVLRAHPWNCAIKRDSLTANATSPEWGFDYAYQQPTDCLRVLEVNGETYEWFWQIENGKILTDLSAPLEIKYIFENTAVGSYDAELVSAISYKLAMSWVEPLVKAANLKAVMFEFYKATLASARSSDGQEGSPRKIEANTWTDVR